MPIKSGYRVLAALVVALALLAARPGGGEPLATVAQAAPGEAKTGRVIVKTRPWTGPRGALDGIPPSGPRPEQYGARDGGGRPGSDARVWRVPAGTEAALAAKLSGRDDVEYAEPDQPRQAHLVPTDPLYADWQWNLPKIEAPSAWDGTVGDPGVVVAVIDSGFDIGHPDRPTNLRLGCDYVAWDPINSPTCPNVAGDPHGHGTHVAGIVAAAQGNGLGLSGVDPPPSTPTPTATATAADPAGTRTPTPPAGFRLLVPVAPR
ncbi:MAG TPA: S8 family serine peptidase [Chloroflexota bacterium]